jgi:hypothetical protein
MVRQPGLQNGHIAGAPRQAGRQAHGRAGRQSRRDGSSAPIPASASCGWLPESGQGAPIIADRGGRITGARAAALWSRPG